MPLAAERIPALCRKRLIRLGVLRASTAINRSFLSRPLGACLVPPFAPGAGLDRAGLHPSLLRKRRPASLTQKARIQYGSISPFGFRIVNSEGG